MLCHSFAKPERSNMNYKHEPPVLGVPPVRQHVELIGRMLHHTTFTSEDGEHKQQHRAAEILPGNTSRAITHERMTKQRELCMLLGRLLSLDPRSLFNRHAVCILQRNVSCPLCSSLSLTHTHTPGACFLDVSFGELLTVTLRHWRCFGFQHSE